MRRRVSATCSTRHRAQRKLPSARVDESRRARGTGSSGVAAPPRARLCQSITRHAAASRGRARRSQWRTVVGLRSRRRPCRGSRARSRRSRRAARARCRRVRRGAAACDDVRPCLRTQYDTVDGSRPTSRAMASIDAPPANRSANHSRSTTRTLVRVADGKARGSVQLDAAPGDPALHDEALRAPALDAAAGDADAREEPAGLADLHVVAERARLARADAPGPGLDRHAVAGRLEARLRAGEQLQRAVDVRALDAARAGRRCRGTGGPPR